VVPGQVDLTLELRSADEARVQRVLETLLARAEAAAKSHGLKLLFSASRVGRAVPMDPGVQDEIEAAAGELALRHVRLTSWAGHDASHFSPIAPTGMIFVPSIGGISHAPEESTSWEDAGAGVKVLAETVCRLDRLAVRAKRP
jgi:N-carbamoyl-L-amino-acid hydrolase